MVTISNIRRRTAVLAAAVAVLAAACGGDTGTANDAPTGPERPSPLPVIVDYSPTVSDAGALLYLASHPDVDLVAVTLAGTGESRCEVGVPNTIGLLALAGKADVPVACGPTEPIGPGHEWPAEWRDAADALFPLEFDPTAAGDARSAVDLLIDTAAATEGVVMVALGPLTNLAAAIEQQPAFADDVAMLYSMGGAIGAAGNAPNGAEWNYYVDPTAVAVVLRSGLPVTLVPLDATDHMPANKGLYSRMRGRDQAPPLFAVRQLWTAATPWTNGSFLWDELTAMLAVDPTLAPVGSLRITVRTDGAEAGRTVAAADGEHVLVAGRPDRRRAEDAFVATLAGSASPR